MTTPHFTAEEGCWVQRRELIRTQGHQDIATLGSEARQGCCPRAHVAWVVGLRCAHALGSRLHSCPAPAGLQWPEFTLPVAPPLGPHCRTE